jgi:hypothetical protein
MNGATTIHTATESKLVINAGGIRLEYAASTDARIESVEDGKIVTVDDDAADALASEIRAWGVSNARGLGSAVVFWA